MNSKLLITFSFLLFFQMIATAQQNEGQLSGDLELQGNFYQRDSAIGASGRPQYDHQFYGANAWLNLNYSNWGFNVGVRFDLYQNSDLPNPSSSYTNQGIGRWYIKKKINKLGISAGYLYDQIGSGIIFRAYELRPLAIDQSLFGIRLTYDIAPDWQIKVFTGRQRALGAEDRPLADPYKSTIRGLSLDGFVVGDSSKVTLAPGFGIVSRTLDDRSMNSLAANLNTYLKEDVFIPKYSTYAFSLYNTLTVGPISWYVEGAYKTDDSFFDPFEERMTVSGDTITGRFVNGEGTVFATSLSFAKKGWGITLEGRRTENFTFRTRPQEEGTRGLLNFLPPMVRLNTYRLTARYAPNVQDIGEQAYQIDVRYAPSRKLSFNANFSNTTDLDNELLYRELYTEIYYKYKRKYAITGGVQVQQYNQEIYQVKPNVPLVESVTPYIDFLYRFSRKKSFRVEAQYMTVGKEKGVRHDYGNWLFGLLEYSIAPNWTFAVSDMYNISPGKLSPDEDGDGVKEKIHFPRIDIFYAYKANRFSISYVKQVEGVVCAGGICRVEPAFSGVRLAVNSTF